MGKLTDEDVRKIADLIKIKIPSDELEGYKHQLETALDVTDDLKELDTTNTPITSQTHGLKNVMREDKAEKSLDMKNYKNTKNFKDGYFVVKKVL